MKLLLDDKATRGYDLNANEACIFAAIYVCPDCADEHLVTCERCGTLMDRDNAYRGLDGYLCECCHDDLFG